MKSRNDAGNIMKRSAALFLALLMICAMFPAEVFADLVWYFDESGNLYAVDEPAAVTEQPQWYVGADGLLYPITEEVTGYTEELTEELPEAVAEEPEQPEEPFTYVTAWAEDSAVFTAYGRFPEGSEMFVTQCDFGGDLMKKVFPAERAEKISEYKAYNVSFTLNGQPYDPEMVPQFTVLPNMQNPLNTLGVAAYSSYVSTVPENENGIVLSSEQVEELTAAGEEDSIHYVSETFYNLFDIEAEQQGDSRLIFWSDLYSPIVIYREGFDFEPVPWVLQSDQSVTLSHILETADLGLGLSDIAEQGIIYLGDPELVKMRVHEFDGDWEITSAQGFTAAQLLRVIFKNGGVLDIELYCEGNEPLSKEESEKETWNDWVEMFADVELSGSWPRDVVTIAATQLGYSAGEDGYTRYGGWYGDEYGDWCAMFCSFCMAFAGVDREVIPFEESCARWVDALKVKELYYEASSGYTPKAGDLIFFSSNGAEADHVGIVYDNEPGQIVTIDGNNPGQVEHKFYLHDDARILGYGMMPAASAKLETKTIESAPAEDGAVAVISGNLPVNAEAVIKAVRLSENEISQYLGGNTGSEIKSYVAYDITILVGGNEWEPNETVSVSIRKPEILPEAGEKLTVAHVDSETNQAKELPKKIDVASGEVSFDTDGFSLYLFYTVDFYNKDVGYSIRGGSSVLLSEILRVLEYNVALNQIESVSFSAPNYVTVEKQGDDWLLRSLQSFDTEEHLLLTLFSGDIVDVFVLDYQAPDVSWLTGASAPSDVTIDKTASPLGENNGEYEVTLTVSGRQGEQSDYYDIALLLDCSNSLSSSDFRSVKNAAKSFLDSVLNGSDFFRVAVIPFSTISKTRVLNGGAFYTSETLVQAKSDIDGLSTAGGTAMSYAEVLAKSVLQNSTQKAVVLMSDGEPNASYKIDGTPEINCMCNGDDRCTLGNYIIPYVPSGNTSESDVSFFNYISPGNVTYKNSTVSANSPSSAPRSDLVVGSVQYTCSKHSKTYTKDVGYKWITLYESFCLKAMGADFYTVGVNLGDTGSRAKLLKQIAPGQYYDTLGDGLNNVFTEIAKKIKNVATNASVTDPMGPDVGLTFNGSISDYTNTLSEYEAGNANVYISSGSLTYDPTTDTISWTIGDVPFGAALEMRYKVKIDDGVYGENIPLNENTNISYKDINGNPQEQSFPVPVGEKCITLVVEKDVPEIEDVNLFPFRMTIIDSTGNAVDVSSKIAALQAAYPDNSISLGKDISGQDIKNVITFNLSDKNSTSDLSAVSFSFIPDEANVKVEELLENEDYVTSVSEDDGEAAPGREWTNTKIKADTHLLFTNTLEQDRTLTVTKIVPGMDCTTEFPFRLEILDKNGDPANIADKLDEFITEGGYTNISLEETTVHVVLFSLTDDHSVSFPFIPKDAKITLSETMNDGYVTTVKCGENEQVGAVWTGDITDDTSVQFTNITGTVLPKTGRDGVSHIYATGALLMASACIYGIILKRKRERRAA